MKRAWELPGFPGVKIRKTWWKKECFIYFNGVSWVDEKNDSSNEAQKVFHEKSWQLYTEPKKTKRVTQHRVTTKTPNGEYITGPWIGETVALTGVLLTETREIEVSE